MKNLSNSENVCENKTSSSFKDGKLYVSDIFDCYDLTVLGRTMDTNMKATLCEQTLKNAYTAYPQLRGVIEHPLIALQRCILLRCHTSCRESATPTEEIPELSAGQAEW